MMMMNFFFYIFFVGFKYFKLQYSDKRCFQASGSIFQGMGKEGLLTVSLVLNLSSHLTLHQILDLYQIAYFKQFVTILKGLNCFLEFLHLPGYLVGRCGEHFCEKDFISRQLCCHWILPQNLSCYTPYQTKYVP